MNSRLGFTLVVLLGCGGGGAIQPRPLGHHFDSQHLNSVDPGQQQAVLEAKSAYDMAQLERNKVKSDLQQIDLELLTATNEAKSAALKVESAVAQEKAAGADLNRQREAAAALKTATLEREVADARRDYVAARKQAEEKRLRWAEFNVYAAEAKFELEKAAVATNNSIAPAGFKYGEYDAQHKQRVAEAAQAKLEADVEQQKLSAKRQALEAKERALAELR